MKILIDVDRFIWGKVKDFATIKDLSLNSAVALLLRNALNEIGYPVENKAKHICLGCKNSQALDEVGEPVANAIGNESSFQQGSQNDYK